MHPAIRNVRLLAATVITFLGAGLTLAADLKEGDKAPDFTLTGSDGKTYALEDFKGKKGVVLAWFPKAFTGGCTTQCKALGPKAEEIRAENVEVFTISCDDVEQNTKFAKSLSATYPILSDADKSVAKAYGVVGIRPLPTRWTFYIDRDGVIRHIDKQVKPATHADVVLAKVKELKLGAGK
jgi:peroxiredoxin Q/BCP